MLLNLHKTILLVVLIALPGLAWGETMPTRETTGPALTSLQLLDDAIHAANAALGKAALIACQFDDVSPGTVTENNVSPVRCSNLRELYGIIRDAAGNARGANVNASNELLVNANTELAAAAALADATVNPTVPGIASYMMTWNGTTWDRAVGSPNVAHDAVATSANPLLVGGYASAAAPTDVSADGDAVRAWHLRNGARVVHPIPGTSGGTTPCYFTSAATNNAQFCKASAGQIYGYEVINTTATLYYLRLYNLAAAPTCSSATGFIRSIPIPASATGAGVVRDMTMGEAYGTGIAFCLTAEGSSTGNTSAATGVYISINYK